MLKDKRIRIITGHYGSGKTEFAMNYVMKLNEVSERKVAIADVDIVNPYFRSREKADLLIEKGIRVISGNRGHAANLDIPMISAEILAPMQDESYDLIVDAGGDSVGARVLGRFQDDIKRHDYDMFCVVNANREETKDLEGVMIHIKAIEAVSGLKITGLINNTHLLRETTVDDVMRGQELVKEVSNALDIPIKYVSVLEKVAHQLPDNIEGEIIPINLFMREAWM